MTTNVEQLTAEAAEAMKLPLRDRDADTEALWFAEAERRIEELRRGKVEGISSDDAFRTAREALKR